MSNLLVNQSKIKSNRFAPFRRKPKSTVSQRGIDVAREVMQNIAIELTVIGPPRFLTKK